LDPVHIEGLDVEVGPSDRVPGLEGCSVSDFAGEGSSLEGAGGNMPGGDNTGPWGRGPMTGRGRGFCSDTYPSWGRGRGFGRGMGQFGNVDVQKVPIEQDPKMAQPREPSPEIEREFLENTIKEMEIELIEIKQRLKELSRE
jgi:uncharacterized protein DUF5320